MDKAIFFYGAGLGKRAKICGQGEGQQLVSRKLVLNDKIYLQRVLCKICPASVLQFWAYPMSHKKQSSFLWPIHLNVAVFVYKEAKCQKSDFMSRGFYRGKLAKMSQ